MLSLSPHSIKKLSCSYTQYTACTRAQSHTRVLPTDSRTSLAAPATLGTAAETRPPPSLPSPRVGRGVTGLVPKADPALRPALAVVELADLGVARIAVVLVAPVAAVGDARELVEPHLVGCAWEGGEESLTVLVLMCAEAAHRSRAIREREPVEDCGSTPRSGEGRGAQHCTTVAHAYYTYYCLCLLESRGHAHLTSPIGWS